MERQKGDFTISTNKHRLNVQYIHHFLSTQSYWAENVPIDVVERSIEGAMCFGVYANGKQIGFARVITDCATFAYLADVFIDPCFRGQAIGKWLMEVIIAHPNLQGLRSFMLATRDAHELYKKVGFRALESPERFMRITNPEVYKRL